MNIGSVQNTGINTTGFKGKEDDDLQRFADRTYEIIDTYESRLKAKDGENQETKKGKKNLAAVILSVAVATAVSYVGGKFVAQKFSTLLPKPAGQISKHLSKLADGKVLTGAKNLAQKNINNLSKTDAKGLNKAGLGAAKILDKGINKIQTLLKSDQALATTAGVVAAAAGTAKLTSVDGNKDGIKDIAQKNVNVYKSALKDVDTLATIATVIS